MKKLYLLVAGVCGYIAWDYLHTPPPTTISLRIGQTFHEVANTSSFPVVASSNLPDGDNNGSGATWITKPSVIVHFNDPQYEFTLPPTTFAAISYTNYRVSTISTSPMLKKLSFDAAFAIADSLQRQFQTKGWRPENNTTWLDLRDKEALHQHLRRDQPAFRNYVELVAPEKYSIIFRFYCSERCDSRLGLDRYLIDVGVGEDYSYLIEKRKQQHKVAADAADKNTE
jgi:hypothetical protein